jgi:hypothetical protein
LELLGSLEQPTNMKYSLLFGCDLIGLLLCGHDLGQPQRHRLSPKVVRPLPELDQQCYDYFVVDQCTDCLSLVASSAHTYSASPANTGYKSNLFGVLFGRNKFFICMPRVRLIMMRAEALDFIPRQRLEFTIP